MNRKSFESIPIPKVTPNSARKNGIGVGVGIGIDNLL